MSRDSKFLKNKGEAVEAKENNSPKSTTPLSREGLKPEPVPDITVSPLSMPKIERDYTTKGITNSPPPSTDDKVNKTPIPPTNGSGAIVGGLPPPKSFSEDTKEQIPPGTTPEDEGPTAATQQFGAPPPAGEKYQMTGNYALRTAEDIYNGLNYFLKWDVSPLLHVKYKGQFVKYQKATERIAKHNANVKPGNIKERLKTHNSGIKDKIAMDQEDHDLIVPPAAEWFRDIGFYITPGWKVAIAGGQILLRKAGHIMEIKRENDEFKEELKIEISQFLDVYENEIKPTLDEIEKKNRRATPPPPAPPETKTTVKPKTKDEKK